MMTARMVRLNHLLDSLVCKSMNLIQADASTLYPIDRTANLALQKEMTAMRVEARQLAKTIRKDIAKVAMET
jgi:hypothetical protein